MLKTRSRALLAAVVLSVLASCAPRPRQLTISGPTMGTSYTVKLANVPAAISEPQVRSSIDALLERVDRSMSGYRPDSEISRFNAAASTQWIEVSAELAGLIAAALQVGERSGGVLDITVAPLVNLWGFGAAGPRTGVPTQQEVERVLEHVGLRKLAARESPPALRKDDPLLSVDLNAVAPGYAVDLLSEELIRLGLIDFMIDIGGEVRVRGRNAQGGVWRIAVERPIDSEPEPYAILQLPDLAVTTSGEYRHYDIREGQRYSHTIDPRTGRPVEHDLAAVVVVSSTALQADAWAIALNVLGEQAGAALAEQQQIPALFIARRGGRWVQRATPGFEQYVVAKPGRSRGN